MAKATSDAEREAITRRSAAATCPGCRGTMICPHNNLATRFPDLRAFWDRKRNGGKALESFSITSAARLVWRCKPESREGKCKCVHEWTTAPYGNMQCPYCRGRLACACSQLTAYPALVAQYRGYPNYTDDAACLKDQVTTISTKGGLSVWWQCGRGHRWQETPKRRVAWYKRTGQCPCRECGE